MQNIKKIQATLNNSLAVKHYKTYNHMIKEKLHQSDAFTITDKTFISRDKFHLDTNNYSSKIVSRPLFQHQYHGKV